MKTKEERRRYNLERYHRLRAEYIELLGGKCVVCGSVKNLEFDHTDRETKTVGRRSIMNVSREWALEELKLCQLLCNQHHRDKSEKAGDIGQVEHGGGNSGKRNCPCEPCKERKREYMREYKKRKNSSPL